MRIGNAVVVPRENMTKSKRYGIIGATSPVLFFALWLISGMVSPDSFIFSVLQRIGSVLGMPFFWPMIKILEGCGIRGDAGMFFIIPMFLITLACWAFIGYGIGCLIGKIMER
jgi:hypothetical protein